MFEVKLTSGICSFQRSLPNNFNKFVKLNYIFNVAVNNNAKQLMKNNKLN